MKWVKATTRLPEGKGCENRVIIKFNGFVTYGFRNYHEENPEIYFEYNNKSYLEKEGVVWLDENE